MRRAFDEIFDAYKASFSGAYLVKSKTNVLSSGASGFANRDFNVPNRIDTRFDTASVTKTFTAAAVLSLAEQGLLRLTDKICDVIDLEGTAIPEDVTVEHLLNHTSGIADDADEEAGEDYAALFIDKPNYSIRSCWDFLPQFSRKEPLFKAGTDVRYNNCAFVLLGLAIEKLTGTDYRSFVSERIFEAAGMKNTYWGAMDEVRPNTATGYFAVRDESGGVVNWKSNIYSYPPIGTPDGGALTTVEDLDIFIRALRDGVLLSPEYTDMIFKPHCDFPRPTRHGTWRAGYAFEFIEADGAVFCMYKEGVNPGANAILSYYPELDITISILSNQDGPFWEIYGKMFELSV
jgi:CubicO group peptidase (beta-lactamase class C family)